MNMADRMKHLRKSKGIDSLDMVWISGDFNNQGLTNNERECIIEKKVLGDFCLLSLIVIERIAK